MQKIEDQDREKWRKSTLESFYRENARPLIEALALSASIDSGQLWGQIVTEMHSQIDTWLIEASDESVKRRITDDFRFLIHGLDADVFGLRKNPYHVRLRTVDNLFKQGCQTYIKAACCLAYRTEDEGNDHKYCYACPRLSTQKREEYKLFILEQQKHRA